MKNIVLLFVILNICESTSTFAQTWSAFGNGLNYPVNSICYYNNTLYAAGGSVYLWDGSNWVDKSNGMILVMDVYSLTVYNNTLFSGGFFTVLTPDQNWYNNAARFYNGSWTTCGSGTGNDGIGMGDYVNALLVYNGQLYAGGRFGTAGGDPLNPQEAPYIARFDGSLWHPVGTGMDFTVTDLCVYNGELIASGFFVEAGGVPAKYIAKWNGSNWSALGSGMDGKVTALAVYNGELYAGGLFNTAGGVPALSIAKWNGQSWSAVGAGIPGGGQVYTLAVYNNELYAGGTFSAIAGNADDYLMKWNGTSWSSVDQGTDGPVVYLYPSGSDLYIGGNFTTAGGISAKNIAAYRNITGTENENEPPLQFSLNQNYPNPFNPVTKITWEVPFESYVEIRIYNILGTEIKTLFSGEKTAGSFETVWNASNFPSGIYFCELKSGSYTGIMKMVLMK